MFSPWRFFVLVGGYRNWEELLGDAPQSLVVVQFLLDGGDSTLLAGLAVLAGSHETALNHLLLQDVEDIPEGITLVFGPDRGQEVVNRLVIDVDVILGGVALANLVGLDGHQVLLVLGEDGGVHHVHLVDGGGNAVHDLGDNAAEFLEGIVDVADGEVGELSVGDDTAVGADEAVATHHEAEGIESVVAVLDDDADLSLEFPVGFVDVGARVCGLHDHHVEGADTLGTLLGSALLSLNWIPAEFLHVGNDGGGVGVNVLAGDCRIGGVLGESVRTNGHDLFVGHRSHLSGE